MEGLRSRPMTLRSLWFRTKLLISRAYGTRMVYGYVRGDGTYLPNTRSVSSSRVKRRRHARA